MGDMRTSLFPTFMSMSMGIVLNVVRQTNLNIAGQTNMQPPQIIHAGNPLNRISLLPLNLPNLSLLPCRFSGLCLSSALPTSRRGQPIIQGLQIIRPGPQMDRPDDSMIFVK
jgi:hypothetical protein